MASPNFDAISVRLSRMINDSVAAASTSGDQVTSAERSAIINSAIRNWINAKLSIGDWLALSGYIQEKSKALSSNAVSLTDSAFSPGIAMVLSVKTTTLTISDSAYSISGTTVSSYATITEEVVGGTFTGKDASSNVFSKTITGYISSTSFTIDSSVVAEGSCTDGVITATYSIPIERLPEYAEKGLVESNMIAGFEPSIRNQFWTIDNGSIYVLGANPTDTVKVRYIQKHTDLSAGGTSDIAIGSEHWNDILNEALNVYSAEYSHTA